MDMERCEADIGEDIFEGKVTGLGGILKIRGKRILVNMILDFWLVQPNVWRAILWDREEENWAREKGDYELNFVCAVFILYLWYLPERSSGCVRPEFMGEVGGEGVVGVGRQSLGFEMQLWNTVYGW